MRSQRAIMTEVLEEYFELLRYESVSADPTKFKASLNCASYLRRWLLKLGFSAELKYPDKAEGLVPPVVMGELKGDDGGTSVLVYGHYDVQPADPLEEWDTPPFEPTFKAGRVYCRGAQDDKGQLFAFLCGVREYLAQKPASRPTIKVLLDGQEESGSKALSQLLPEIRERLSAELLLVCDTSAAEDLRPAIVAGMRGVGKVTLKLTAANRDLHSGEYGGVAPNAAAGMAQLLSSLHTPDGAVAVAGFKDGIEMPTHEELRLAEASSPSESDLAADIGCESVGGQIGKTIAQRMSFEPTIEVNGIVSGYGGEGVKTVIPCEAVAKLSLRYVPGQSPRGAFAALKEHLERNCPRGMKLEIIDPDPGLPGFRLPLSSPAFRLAEDVLKEMDDRGAVFLWDGASIPIVSAIIEATGAAPLIVGWGQAQDRIHSPNESYGEAQFGKAREWAKRILWALSKK